MVEVTNRSKGLDLIDRVPEEIWPEVHYIAQEAGLRTIPKKKKCKRLNGLDLIVPEELGTEVCDIVQEAVIKTHPRKTNAKRQNVCLRRTYKQLRKEEK